MKRGPEKSRFGAMEERTKKRRPGQLIANVDKISRLLENRLLNRLLGLPLVFEGIVTQALLCFVTLVLHDRSDVEGVLVLLLDQLAFLALGSMHRIILPSVKQYRDLLLKARPLIEAFDAEVSGRSNARLVEAWIALGRKLAGLGYTMDQGSVAAVVIAPLISGNTFFDFWQKADRRTWVLVAKQCLQMYTLVPCLNGGAVMQSLHVVSISGLVAMFTLLQKNLQNLFHGPAQGSANSIQRLHHLTRLHSLLAELSMEVNYIVQRYLSVMFWGEAEWRCFVHFGKVASRTMLVCGFDFRGVSVIAVAPVRCFWLCLLGDLIAEASMRVEGAARTCDWLRAPPSARRVLAHLMLRAQRPLVVSVSYIGPMTLAFFMSTLSFWYNNVTLMRNVIQKRTSAIGSA